ncbi:hypothetical protein N7495_006001 [Penicillium taxi]|uniref:uncharacterized protein n=1 Tax=Penicillium taxi TaxID=168475 RepID=UPI0025450F96|nr:uncharacterized protein N7495_006001 [Penicillium taxi]KAJ5894310.1 hypothetical protein N7495_006001 [Penicillium taxi]
MSSNYESTIVARDFDTKWVQWLARRKNPSALSQSSSIPLPIPSVTLHDSGSLHSRSTATTYFALLSGAQDQQQPYHQGRQHTASSSIDSSWVRLFDREAQRSGRPINSGAGPQQTTSVEPALTSTTPMFAVSSLDPLHLPLNAPFLDSEAIPGTLDNDLVGLGDLDFEFTEQDAELLTWLDDECLVALENPVGSKKRSLDFLDELSVSKKQLVDRQSGSDSGVEFSSSFPSERCTFELSTSRKALAG